MICVPDRLQIVLYIGELIDMLNDAGCTGIFIDDQAPNIMALLFADDIALVNDTVGRLKELIKILEKYTQNWGMKVNLEKTKIIIFRRGGALKSIEKFWFLDKEIEIVNIMLGKSN